MELSPETIGMAGGAGGVGAFGVWLVKRMIDRIETGQERLFTKIGSLELSIAKLEGRDDVLWREIGSKGDRIVKLESSQERAWETISKIAQPRISDIISSSLKKED